MPTPEKKNSTKKKTSQISSGLWLWLCVLLLVNAQSSPSPTPNDKSLQLTLPPAPTDGISWPFLAHALTIAAPLSEEAAEDAPYNHIAGEQNSEVTEEAHLAKMQLGIEMIQNNQVLELIQFLNQMSTLFLIKSLATFWKAASLQGGDALLSALTTWLMDTFLAAAQKQEIQLIKCLAPYAIPEFMSVTNDRNQELRDIYEAEGSEEIAPHVRVIVQKECERWLDNFTNEIFAVIAEDNVERLKVLFIYQVDVHRLIKNDLHILGTAIHHQAINCIKVLIPTLSLADFLDADSNGTHALAMAQTTNNPEIIDIFEKIFAANLVAAVRNQQLTRVIAYLKTGIKKSAVEAALEIAITKKYFDIVDAFLNTEYDFEEFLYNLLKSLKNSKSNHDIIKVIEKKLNTREFWRQIKNPVLWLICLIPAAAFTIFLATNRTIKILRGKPQEPSQPSKPSALHVQRIQELTTLARSLNSVQAPLSFFNSAQQLSRQINIFISEYNQTPSQDRQKFFLKSSEFYDRHQKFFSDYNQKVRTMINAIKANLERYRDFLANNIPNDIDNALDIINGFLKKGKDANVQNLISFSNEHYNYIFEKAKSYKEAIKKIESLKKFAKESERKESERLAQENKAQQIIFLARKDELVIHGDNLFTFIEQNLNDTEGMSGRVQSIIDDTRKATTLDELGEINRRLNTLRNEVNGLIASQSSPADSKSNFYRYEPHITILTDLLGFFNSAKRVTSSSSRPILSPPRKTSLPKSSGTTPPKDKEEVKKKLPTTKPSQNQEEVKKKLPTAKPSQNQIAPASTIALSEKLRIARIFLDTIKSLLSQCDFLKGEDKDINAQKKHLKASIIIAALFYLIEHFKPVITSNNIWNMRTSLKYHHLLLAPERIIQLDNVFDLFYQEVTKLNTTKVFTEEWQKGLNKSTLLYQLLTRNLQLSEGESWKITNTRHHIENIDKYLKLLGREKLLLSAVLEMTKKYLASIETPELIEQEEEDDQPSDKKLDAVALKAIKDRRKAARDRHDSTVIERLVDEINALLTDPAPLAAPPTLQFLPPPPLPKAIKEAHLPPQKRRSRRSVAGAARV